MADANTRAMVGVLGAHNYDGNDPSSPPTNYGKSVWETEVSTSDAYDGSMDNALTWAAKIHAFLVMGSVNGWHFWWLISQNPDNEGLTNQAGSPAKRMYVMGNYSKFVRPGWVRVAVSGSESQSVSAYRDPSSNKFAIVAINSGSAASTTFKFSGLTATTVTPWVTSSSISLVAQTPVNVSGSSFNYTLPASSVTTFVNPSNPSDVTPPKAPSGLRINP